VKSRSAAVNDSGDGREQRIKVNKEEKAVMVYAGGCYLGSFYNGFKGHAGERKGKRARKRSD